MAAIRCEYCAGYQAVFPTDGKCPNCGAGMKPAPTPYFEPPQAIYGVTTCSIHNFGSHNLYGGPYPPTFPPFRRHP